MPLERQVITMPLAQGVDTKTDDKQVVAGKLLELENGVFTRLKAIQKRNGYAALGRTIGNRVDAVVPQFPESTSPSLWYRFDDGAGVAQARNTGLVYPYAPTSDNTATLVPNNPANVTWSGAFPGLTWADPCMHLTDEDTRVFGLASQDPLGGASQLAVSLWVLGDGIDNNRASYYTTLIESAAPDYNATQYAISWGLASGNATQAYGYMEIGSGTHLFQFTSGMTVNDVNSSVRFIVLNYDGSAITAWVNGVLTNTVAATGTVKPVPIVPSRVFGVGRTDGIYGLHQSAKGWYADMRVSTTALTPAQITAMWAQGMGL